MSSTVSPGQDRLVGLVVKASTPRAEDSGFKSRLRRKFPGSSHTSDVKIGTPVATPLPGSAGGEVAAWTHHHCSGQPAHGDDDVVVVDDDGGGGDMDGDDDDVVVDDNDDDKHAYDDDCNFHDDNNDDDDDYGHDDDDDGGGGRRGRELGRDEKIITKKGSNNITITTTADNYNNTYSMTNSTIYSENHNIAGLLPSGGRPGLRLLPHRHVGLVVKASASRAEGPGFESR